MGGGGETDRQTDRDRQTEGDRQTDDRVFKVDAAAHLTSKGDRGKGEHSSFHLHH